MNNFESIIVRFLFKFEYIILSNSTSSISIAIYAHKNIKFIFKKIKQYDNKRNKLVKNVDKF